MSDETLDIGHWTLDIGPWTVLGNQAKLLRHLHGLRSSFGIQLIEEPAGVGLDGVFADE